MVLISAHRCGPGDDVAAENTLEALKRAIELDLDYVEFDVQRRGDGALVLSHDEAANDSPAYADALDLLAGRTKAHVDLKFAGAGVLTAVQQAVGALGPSDVLVTSHDDRSVREIRDWADINAPGMLTGLALTGWPTSTPLVRQGLSAMSEVWPAGRVRRSRADVLVTNHSAAGWRALRWASTHGLKALVWTVDDPRELRRWLSDPRVWMVTTNYPERALELAGRG